MKRLVLLVLAVTTPLAILWAWRREAGNVSGDACVRAALAARDSGELARSAAELRKATALPLAGFDRATVWTTLGNVYTDLGDLERAADAHTRALELSPGMARAWSNLGVVRRRQGDLDGAVRCYERAAHLAPDYAPVYASLGVVHILRDEPGRAVESIEHAVRLDPGLAAAWANLGLACALTRNFERARECVVRAEALGYPRAAAVRAKVEAMRAAASQGKDPPENDLRPNAGD